MTEWIAGDWGNTRLRLWGMAGDDVLWRAQAATGPLARADFAPALRRLAGDRLRGGAPVLLCGMVGAREGWAEAPYAAVPCVPLAAGLTPVPGLADGLRVAIVGGLRQSAPPDILRGEETQIAGFLSLNPGFDGILCLPGTHSKWAEVSAGEVVSFRSFLTGEMFAALGAHTVLRHSLAADGWDEDAFAQAVADTMSRPEHLAARLATIRAETVLSGLAPGTARARLSGLLIGAEMAAARPYWLGRQVAVIGGAPVAAPYVAALRAQGVPVTEADAEAMVLRGLTRARVPA